MKLDRDLGNGFAITEYEVREKEQLENLSIDILRNGICIGTEIYENISFEEKERLVAMYIAMEMDVFGVDESPLISERVRFAKKVTNLRIINDYRLIVPIDQQQPFDCEVQLLSSGKFAMSTCVYGLTSESLIKLQEKLNRIKQFQLDVRHQVRPLYGVEIIAMIS